MIFAFKSESSKASPENCPRLKSDTEAGAIAEAIALCRKTKEGYGLSWNVKAEIFELSVEAPSNDCEDGFRMKPERWHVTVVRKVADVSSAGQ